LEHVLRACPELESPRRRNFVQVPPPLSAMSTDQVEVARFFQEVYQWPPGAECRSTTTTTTTWAHCGLLGNKRVDDRARRAAGLGPDNGAQRWRISFEVIKGLIWSQVKDRPPSHVCTSQVYGDGPFKCFQGI
jgi:hypothetical protein